MKIASNSENLCSSINISDHRTEETQFEREGVANDKHEKPLWENDNPNPWVPFPNQPTFVVKFEFYASRLEEHINDPEPYLPGQIHGLGLGCELGPTHVEAVYEAFEKNDIPSTIDYGSDKTMAWPGHDFQEESCIPLWQIKSTGVSWKPLNLERYAVVAMTVVSPVFRLVEENYKEVDRVVDIIIQTLRVQKEEGPGIKVRCESRKAFRWPDNKHHLPANLKQNLEARFSHVPQVDQKRRAAFVKQTYNRMLSTGPPQQSDSPTERPPVWKAWSSYINR
ncbi:hypothetical protein SBOR_8296 [Sclerotinia borealis F-4128]|uniref:Uncharacterized protein n=1 Tax=Sclerotinia borealis (strain F-4128) TaxID=1432307 RepID=W9C660_SCLBF|nr:hypothetical protein SBOR_8296 [Sclerotinia borealis F-4128]